MLVQFAIETKAIDNSATPAHITRLLDRWGRFGILVYPRRGDPALRDRITRTDSSEALEDNVGEDT